jgi:peptidoglycan/LPS O-acetylase OafA/YrhL
MDSANEKTTSSHRLPSLDGLRALSITLVILGHGSGTAKALSPFLSRAMGLVGVGHIGVSIFFVISGFLITTLLLREQMLRGSISLKNFYLRRTFRIFPAFYAYWMVALGLTLFGFIHLARSELISAAIYVWNYMPRKADSWFLGHTWSLSVEEQFYLIWPLLVALWGPTRATRAAVVVMLTDPLLRVAAYFLLPGTRPLIGMMLPTRADSLLAGGLLAIACRDEVISKTVKNWTKSSLIPLLFVLFVALDTMLLRYKGAYLLPFGYSLQNLMIVALVAHAVFHYRTRLGRLLNHPAVVHVGVISYSLYLWQQLFLTPKNTTFSGKFPLNIACAFLAAELSYRFIEKPFLRWRQEISGAAQKNEELAGTASRGASKAVAASA